MHHLLFCFLNKPGPWRWYFCFYWKWKDSLFLQVCLAFPQRMCSTVFWVNLSQSSTSDKENMLRWYPNFRIIFTLTSGIEFNIHLSKGNFMISWRPVFLMVWSDNSCIEIHFPSISHKKVLLWITHAHIKSLSRFIDWNSGKCATWEPKLQGRKIWKNFVSQSGNQIWGENCVCPNMFHHVRWISQFKISLLLQAIVFAMCTSIQVFGSRFSTFGILHQRVKNIKLKEIGCNAST